MGQIGENVYIASGLKEFFSSVFMFLLLNVPEVSLSAQWYIVYQYIAIIFFDYITGGATANPAVSAAMVLEGSINLTEGVAHLFGCAMAAIVTHPLLALIIPEERLTVTMYSIFFTISLSISHTTT